MMSRFLFLTLVPVFAFSTLGVAIALAMNWSWYAPFIFFGPVIAVLTWRGAVLSSRVGRLSSQAPNQSRGKRVRVVLMGTLAVSVLAATVTTLFGLPVGWSVVILLLGVIGMVSFHSYWSHRRSRFETAGWRW